MSRLQLVLVGASLAFMSLSASAHHSRAIYDMDQEIVINGTVVDLAWKNPHIFVTVEPEGAGVDARVEIEVASVSEARALGLQREAIAPGQRVEVRAHPGRRDSAVAVGLTVTASDGTIYPLNTDARLTIRAEAVEAQGIAGHWVPTLESFNDVFPAMQAWPYTEAGLATVTEALGRINTPSIAFLGICEPFPPPTLAMFPDLRTIEVDENRVVLRFEGAVGVAMERIIHLDQNEHPANLVPSLMGHSIGRWEDGVLVIDTVGFAPHAVGALIFPTGSGKHLVERLALTDDRLKLAYTFTLEDPELLSAPVSYTALWDHRPDLEFSGETCDPEAARRPLE